MKALIANRLDDGEVVFWNKGAWVRRFADAELWADDDPKAGAAEAAGQAQATAVIDAEPQVQALCWFLDDFPHDTQWDWFSLTRQPGLLVAAAEEFDALVRGGP